MVDLELLRRLCAARGISGSENEVRDLILEEIRPHVTSVRISPLGNIIAFKRGAKRPKIRLMLNAHMDEVGMGWLAGLRSRRPCTFFEKEEYIMSTYDPCEKCKSGFPIKVCSQFCHVESISKQCVTKI